MVTPCRRCKAGHAKEQAWRFCELHDVAANSTACPSRRWLQQLQGGYHPLIMQARPEGLYCTAYPDAYPGSCHKAGQLTCSCVCLTSLQHWSLEGAKPLSWLGAAMAFPAQRSSVCGRQGLASQLRPCTRPCQTCTRPCQTCPAEHAMSASRRCAVIGKLAASRHCGRDFGQRARGVQAV
jgi:hypothetical protein